MSRPTETCDECGSSYFLGTSEMRCLCGECSHVLYGYPQCAHEIEAGACVACGWDGSRSTFIAHLIERHNMTDAELRAELEDIARSVAEVARYDEVMALLRGQAEGPMIAVPLEEVWAMERYANTEDGLRHLQFVLNGEHIVKLSVPNAHNEAITLSRLIPVSEHLETASSSDCRKFRIALGEET